MSEFFLELFTEEIPAGLQSSARNNLSKKLEDFQNQEKIEQKKQTEFTEKIDELNQETDSLLEEIDKWQT